LLDAQPVGFPHIDARHRDPHPLAGTQFLLEELIQGFLLALPAKPHWLAGIQVADYGYELLLFPLDGFHPRPFAPALACVVLPPNCGTFSILMPQSGQHTL
jgi:hypothetical protein